jgi:hypothetical protein
MYLQCNCFVDDKLVKEVLSKNHIVKIVSFSHKVRYANSDVFGIFDMETLEDGTEIMTREVAIPKSTPDLVITEDNYGEYQAGKVFDDIFMRRLVEIVISSL